jgi:hypothetical protein
MEFEIPTSKLTKAEFLESIEVILAQRGFERKGQRFIRKPEGYVRAQVVEFAGAGGRLGQFKLAPYLLLKGRAQRGAAALRNHEFGALLSDFGVHAGVERANYISFYDNWFSTPDWLDLFERVLDAVLSRVEPVMNDQAGLQDFLDKDYPPSRVVQLRSAQSNANVTEKNEQ